METLAGNLKMHLHMKKKIMWFPSYKIIVKQMQFYYQDVFQDISNLTSSCCHPVLQRELYTRSLIELTQKLTQFRTVSESAFNSVWRKYLPHIVITKPMSDLCLQCQKHSSAIVRSTNTSQC